MRAYLVVLCVLATALSLAQDATTPPPTRVAVENFEQGIGNWHTNDDVVAGTGPAGKCAIYAVAGGAPDTPGAHSGRVEFYNSRQGWASVTLPVDGYLWAQQDASTLAFWLRGDGSGEPLRIVLRVQTDQPKRDTAYSQVIRVDGTDWERYSLRSFGFKDTSGNQLAASDIQHIKLLQFAKNGGWGTFRFRVDEIAVEGDPAHLPIPKPDEGTTGRCIVIEPDMARAAPHALAQIGVNLGPLPTIIDTADEEMSSWAYAMVSDLSPCVVRLQLNDYFDARERQYDLDALDEHLAWVKHSGCKPMICLNVPSVPQDSDDAKQMLFALFLKTIRTIAQRCAAGGLPAYYEVFDEPLLCGAFRDMEHVCAAYNSITDLVVAADPKATVGGPGLSSAWDEHLSTFLKNAKRLDFLSLHFYGTHNVTTDSEALFEAAYRTKTRDLPNQISMQGVRRLTKQLRRKPVQVFVTEFALNSARDEAGDCRDERAGTAFGAAWIGAAVLSAAPYVDKMLHYQLRPGGWGAVYITDAPQAPYWSAWLLKHYAPRGSVLQHVALVDDYAVAATFKTRSSHNVVICYAGMDPLEFRVRPRNAPQLQEVRDRYVTDLERQWKGSVRPAQLEQTIVMRGPGVFVLQYVVRQAPAPATPDEQPAAEAPGASGQ